MSEDAGFESVMGVEATAVVTHNYPCVPECNVCNPKGEIKWL